MKPIFHVVLCYVVNKGTWDDGSIKTFQNKGSILNSNLDQRLNQSINPLITSYSPNFEKNLDKVHTIAQQR